MSVFRKNPVFVSSLAVLALLAVGEGACIYERWAAAREAATTLARKEAELRAMADLVPPPTRAIATAIEADLARGQHALETMQAELKGRGPAADRFRAARPPAARTDAYFDLATFVEQTHALAKKQDIELKPEAAHLGFAAYANEGPETERIAPVFRQRLVAQYLVEALFEARPRALLSVQRERPLTKAECDARDAAWQAAKDAAAAGQTPAPVSDSNFTSVPDGPDFFAIDPRATARVPGAIDTIAFKLVFTGQTAALRGFLNKLAGFDLPVLVREVEVLPATADEVAPAPAAEDATASTGPIAPSVVLTAAAPAATAASKPAAKIPAVAPIVAKPWCKFIVTLEYLDLVPPATATADTGADAAKPTT